MVAAQNILKLAELSLNLQAYLDRIKLSGNPTVVSIEHQPQGGHPFHGT